MKELKILQLTDAVGRELEYYSKQLEVVIEGKHISDTQYFLTDGNVQVDIDKNIDIENTHIKKVIELGAVVKTMYYVEDRSFSHHIYNFEPIGMWHGAEYAEEHGIVFELEKDAIRYEKYVSLVEEKIEVGGYIMYVVQCAIWT